MTVNARVVKKGRCDGSFHFDTHEMVKRLHLLLSIRTFQSCSQGVRRFETKSEVAIWPMVLKTWKALMLGWKKASFGDSSEFMIDMVWRSLRTHEAAMKKENDQKKAIVPQTDTEVSDVLRTNEKVVMGCFVDNSRMCAKTEYLMDQLAKEEKYKDLKFMTVKSPPLQHVNDLSCISYPTFIFFKDGCQDGKLEIENLAKISRDGAAHPVPQKLVEDKLYEWLETMTRGNNAGAGTSAGAGTLD